MQQAWGVVRTLQEPWQQKWKRGASIIAPRTSRDLIAPPLTSESSKLPHLVIKGLAFQNGKIAVCWWSFIGAGTRPASLPSFPRLSLPRAPRLVARPAR